MAQPMAPPGITAGVGVLDQEEVGDTGQARVAPPLGLVGDPVMALAQGQDQGPGMDMVLEVVELMVEDMAPGLVLAALVAEALVEDPAALAPTEATFLRNRETEPTTVDELEKERNCSSYICTYINIQYSYNLPA